MLLLPGFLFRDKFQGTFEIHEEKKMVKEKPMEGTILVQKGDSSFLFLLIQIEGYFKGLSRNFIYLIEIIAWNFKTVAYNQAVHLCRRLVFIAVITWKEGSFLSFPLFSAQWRTSASKFILHCHWNSPQGGCSMGYVHRKEDKNSLSGWVYNQLIKIITIIPDNIGKFGQLVNCLSLDRERDAFHFNRRRYEASSFSWFSSSPGIKWLTRTIGGPGIGREVLTYFRHVQNWFRREHSPLLSATLWSESSSSSGWLARLPDVW